MYGLNCKMKNAIHCVETNNVFSSYHAFTTDKFKFGFESQRTTDQLQNNKGFNVVFDSSTLLTLNPAKKEFLLNI